ncbi:MAG TPA: glycosyltransferase family 9 protein [Clostridia bacterium]|nr:glycosyltransferase family 9 protein [Clostridia bacterium]
MSSELATFYRRTRAARKIIVVDLGFLGDEVHLVPALWELRRHYPEAELQTLSAPVGAEVLKLAPCVTRPRVFPLAPESPPWWRHWDVIRELRRERFDLAFNFSGADRSIFLTALTGARWRLGHEGGRKHFWNRRLIPEWVTRRSTDLPVYEQRRQVLAACGMDLEPARFDLRLPAPALARAETLVPSDALHFSINASTPLKEWPLAHWVRLTQSVLARDAQARVIATGSAAPREQARLRELHATVADPRLVPLPTGLTIPELGAVLSRCRLHVGADSGVLHFAMALGVPTLALFRDYTGKNEWLPRGAQHRHLVVPCDCANRREPPCAATGVARCLKQIQPDQVLALVETAVGPKK